MYAATILSRVDVALRAMTAGACFLPMLHLKRLIVRNAFRGEARMACGFCVGFLLLFCSSSGAASSALQPVSLKLLREVANAPQNNESRRVYFGSLLVEAGCPLESIEFQKFSASRTLHTNVYTVLNGSSANAATLIVGAHTDSMGGGRGVIDNWSGCVLLAALYSELKGTVLNHRIILIGFDAEELGALGSKAFLAKSGRRERGQIRAMVNLECLGAGELRTWANGGTDALEEFFRVVAKEAGIPSRSEHLFRYHADALPFVQARIPAVTIHSLSPPMLSVINGSRDSGVHIDQLRMIETLAVLKSYLLRLDAQQSPVSYLDRESAARPVDSGLVEATLLQAKTGGVSVEDLPRSSPEFIAGLRSGERLLSIQGYPLTRPEEVLSSLDTLYCGQRVEWEIGDAAVTEGEGGSINRIRKVTVVY